MKWIATDATDLMMMKKKREEEGKVKCVRSQKISYHRRTCHQFSIRGETLDRLMITAGLRPIKRLYNDRCVQQMFTRGCKNDV